MNDHILRYSIVHADEESSYIPVGIFDLGLKPHQVGLYCYLISKIDKTDRAIVSLNQMASKMGSKRTLIDNLRKLEEMGLIKKVSRTGDDGANLSNAYIVYNPDILGV
ncbi:MAG: hypothetical protein E6Z15_07320 [Paenibacillus macerans]|nr:hypothetical protein [Paenibacillus macerans]